MTSWKKYVLAAVMVTAALFAYSRNLHKNVPPDFRDAPRDPALDTLKDINPAGVIGDVKVPNMPKISKGYVAGNDPSAGVPTKPVEWVTITGGKFRMGTDSGENGFENAKPIHEVSIKTFAMSKTDVTVEQYAECVIKGGCTEPATGDYCNWGVAGRQLHPINCVDWDQASKYAKFKGGRLPSEAEWEYAATSGGKNQKYPWGNDEATCDKAVMYGNGGYGCGKNSTMPVCSKTAGNTAQGLCDMVGNVWQWVQDKYQDSYKGAPADGSAFEAAGSLRVMRGGSFGSDVASSLRAGYRYSSVPGGRYGSLGFRLAR
ncbi:MAG: hypothetical protein A2270_11510 [Elusimicrobia bacterium RIFOXYA12_FULL_51_18]|nr:MAG: hypothetical protein A2270_11510 [Elusimicrobia bacterium RIFOXYA12_FULL_51_18]OGS28793.1 MAG: hypothetical protein A2218_08970 [Elusimicrobia bacterium RIFOXYA2_FULL_53_38]